MTIKQEVKMLVNCFIVYTIGCLVISEVEYQLNPNRYRGFCGKWQ